MQPGAEWPIFNLLAEKDSKGNSKVWSQTFNSLADVPAASRSNRWDEFETLFIGKTEPPIWLYQSMHQGGRVPGPVTFQLQHLYADAGVEMVGAELADHASMQFAFLAFLYQQAETFPEIQGVWEKAARSFINKHAGTWLPDVGRRLAQSELPPWKAVGYLILSLLDTRIQFPTFKSRDVGKIPIINQGHLCTLCGFCAQTCLTKALKVQETGTKTALVLTPQRCTGCNKCEEVCFSGALQLTDSDTLDSPLTLYASTRAICPACKKPTVSEAELAFVSRQLGNPDWLAYCLDCRVLI